MSEKDLPKRKQMRLQQYNYATNGAYFVTVCTKDRQSVLGTVTVQHTRVCANSEDAVGYGLDRTAAVQLTPYGEIVKNELENIPNHFPHVRIDKFVVMPNHVHAIIIIETPSVPAGRSRPSPTMSTIVGLFKSGASRKIGTPIWQRSYHDHVIRNEQDYQMIWEYIRTNPHKWAEDCYYMP